ncbi:MAG TPA: glycosyl hydrolase [Yinghuangia sp.]|uniref:glycoside hydrolase family 26 protein n=1 Tax=Yinghuangia sp. YIM S10712 TaxID=3436930 RepID=UPI002BB708D3|nr:glycosyl hydrolase [Yinghuangia sp.]
MRITVPRILGVLVTALIVTYAFVLAPKLVHENIASEAPGVGPIPEEQPPPTWLEQRIQVEPTQVFPEAGKTFLGIMTSRGSYDLGPVDEFSEAVEREPQVLQFSVGWADSPFDRRLFDQVAKRGMMPLLAWEPWDFRKENPVEELRGLQPEYALTNIISGKFDAYITSWAQGVKELGYPVGIRFAHEMNGFWYPWAAQANGNTADQYIQAWRHVHDIFTAAGATDVTWVWSPNRDYENATPLKSLYPGDEYVDWVGLSGYFGTKGVEQYKSFNEIFQPSVRQIREFTSRPIVVTETGAVDFDGMKAAWITEMFRQLPENPDIIGVIWYEARKEDEADWRISVSESASTAYRAGMSAPRYDLKWTVNSTPLRELPPAAGAPPSAGPSASPSASATTKPPTTKPPTTKAPTTTTKAPTGGSTTKTTRPASRTSTARATTTGS